MKYIAGIDGGGTKTRCLLGDTRGEVLGEGLGGPSNPVSAGMEEARCSLEEAFFQACTRARIPPEGTCLAVVAGLAGGSTQEVQQEVGKALREITGAEKVQVTTDLHIALEGGLPPGPGIIVIAGTGSSALGRDGAGHLARAGGHGPYLGDEGGGYWIVKTAVARILRERDRTGVPSPLELALEKGKQKDLSWPRFFAQAPPGEIAALAPLVLERAEKGDPWAGEILERAGKELARLARDVAARLFGAAPPAGLAVAPLGSILARFAGVRRAFQAALDAPPPFQILEPKADPARGALLLARKLALA
ncbi:MAG TPA: hypothetical protein ENJ97_04210 [Planctomycetes bacterium]|nr:hypothetical protein [Planctomycetota bacterium]